MDTDRRWWPHMDVVPEPCGWTGQRCARGRSPARIQASGGVTAVEPGPAMQGRRMSDTKNLPDLDSKTIEELQPGCTSLKDPWEERGGECQQPAQWIVTKTCCGAVGFRCDYHKKWWENWYATGRDSHCWTCDYTGVAPTRVEKL